MHKERKYKDQRLAKNAWNLRDVEFSYRTSSNNWWDWHNRKTRDYFTKYE